MNPIIKALLLVSPLALSAAAQNAIDPAARRAIDAGNQAWVDGMKNGDAARIAETYGEDAVDCPPDGNCIHGRAAIENYFKQRLAKSGRAQAASVTTAGSVQQGEFVYEWGHAEATLADGKRVGGRYLTAWERQADGSWKIFRNMPIPDDRGR